MRARMRLYVRWANRDIRRQAQPAMARRAQPAGISAFAGPLKARHAFPPSFLHVDPAIFSVLAGRAVEVYLGVV